MSNNATATAPVLATADEYRAADTSTKARMRRDADNAMRAALAAGDLAGAQAAMATAATYGPATPAKAEVDYVGIAAHRVATLRAAADLIESGAVIPGGFPDTYMHEGDVLLARVADVVAEDVDEPARVIAGVKVTRAAASGPRHDIGTAIVDAFSGLEPGEFMSAGAIARAQGLPSSGAVPARLFPRNGQPCNVPTVTPVRRADGYPADGAIKA